MNKRKPYLDNIRWATVLLVMLYHVGYIFNGVGILGGVPEAQSLRWADWLIGVPYPWFMVLLFVVSGICARYALEKRSGKEFLRERARKLLVPSTLGLFVIHWITGYFNIKMGGALQYIPAFLVYPIAVMSGIGPLWFIQMLFLFSAALVLLRKMDREEKLWNLCGKANGWVAGGLVLVIWAAAQVGNMPVITTYRFGIYFAAFLLGYLVFSHEEVQKQLEAFRWGYLGLALVFGIGYCLKCCGGNFTEGAVLESVLTNAYLWFAVLAILGLMRKYGNGENPVTRYLAKNSFGLYILHYPVLITVCYLLQYHTALSAGWKYLLAALVMAAGTGLTNEAVRRIPLIRTLVLGIRK